MKKNILDLEDSMMDMVVKMSEGNPGAVSCLAELAKAEKEIDPDSAFSSYGVGTMFQLDSMGIYGSPIYVLWNDQCSRNSNKMLGLMRCYQLGYLTESYIQKLAADQSRSDIIPEEKWDNMKAFLTKELPNFKVW